MYKWKGSFVCVEEYEWFSWFKDSEVGWEWNVLLEANPFHWRLKSNKIIQ